MSQIARYRSAMMFVAGAATMALVFLALDAFKKNEPGSTPAVHPPVGQATPTTAPPEAAPPAIDEAELKRLEAIVEKTPGDAQALVNLANLLYDAKRYEDSIAWYGKALVKDPRNVSVSTDMGTALWYIGRADEAIAQFEKSLAIEPTHPQTLYNMGIVKLHGKNDAPGALAAWEKLIQTNPDNPMAVELKPRVETLRSMK